MNDDSGKSNKRDTDSGKPTSSQESEDSMQFASPEEKAFINEFIALSQTGILIKKNSIHVRAFSMEGHATVLAYVLAELNDSYIVLMPSTVSSSASGLVKCNPMTVVNMVKLHKSKISVTAIPPTQYLYYYLVSTKNRFSSMKGYFNSNRCNQVDALISSMEQEYGYEKQKISPIQELSKPKTDISKLQPKVTKSNSLDIDVDDLAINKRKKQYLH